MNLDFKGITVGDALVNLFNEKMEKIKENTYIIESVASQYDWAMEDADRDYHDYQKIKSLCQEIRKNLYTIKNGED